MLTKRGFLGILSGAIAAPLVAKAELLMPLRGYKLYVAPSWCPPGWIPAAGQSVSGLQFPELYDQYKRMRMWGAEKGTDLKIPDCQPFGFYGSYEYSPNSRSKSKEVVRLINTKSVTWANGNLVRPGMIVDFAIPTS